jgi:hypothetical protein
MNNIDRHFAVQICEFELLFYLNYKPSSLYGN